MCVVVEGRGLPTKARLKSLFPPDLQEPSVFGNTCSVGSPFICYINITNTDARPGRVKGCLEITHCLLLNGSRDCDSDRGNGPDVFASRVVIHYSDLGT